MLNTNKVKHLGKDPLFQFGHRAKGHHVTKGMILSVHGDAMSFFTNRTETEDRVGIQVPFTR